MQGVILKGIGGFYYVDTQDGIVECKARGKFRHNDETPYVGDRVLIELTSENTGYLLEIFERKNMLIRPAISNIELLVIVASEAPPKTDLFLVDKVCAIAQNYSIDVCIFVNKTDIETGISFKEIYEKAGYKVILGSAKTGVGIDLLKDYTKGKVTCFTGNSAVGKSSILNQIDDRFDLKVGGMSEKIGRGKHTTRHVELLKVDSDTFVADTPGFSSFDTTKMDLVLKENLQHTFIEFEDYIGECQFTSCMHVCEKGCAVLKALDDSEISKSRHENYVKLYDSVKDMKPWEMKNSK